MKADTSSRLSRIPDKERRRLCGSIPKVELHQHLEGSFFPETLLRVDQQRPLGLESRDRSTLKALYQFQESSASLQAFLQVFERIANLFRTPEHIELLTKAVLTEAIEDQVRVLELRFSPIYMAATRGLPADEVCEAVLSAIDSMRSDFLGLGGIIIVERQRALEDAWHALELAKRYQANGILGFDLANDERNFPPELFSDVFRAAQERKLGITVHAGEDAGPKSIETAMSELGAKRIGHGATAVQSEALLEHMREIGVHVEVCLTSNLQTGVCDRLSAHPLRRFLAEELSVSICTDDPGVCDTRLSEELFLAVSEFDISREQLRAMAQNACQHSFFATDQRRKMAEQVLRELDPLLD